MLNGKTVTIDHIIENLNQDYGFQNVDKSEVAEWIWRSMSIIGNPSPYEDKNVTYTVADYRAILPVNLYSIEGVRDKVTGLPLREMTDAFSKFPESAYDGTTEIIADYDPAYPSTYISNTEEYYETIVGPEYSSEYFTYKVQGNFMYLGFETGTIEMQYKAIPIDTITGFPTVPDNAIYIRGVVSFIGERLAFRMMLKDLLSEKKYELIRQDYFFNVGAAMNVCKMPDKARMETLINRWKSTYLGPGHFDTGFKYLGSRE